MRVSVQHIEQAGSHLLALVNDPLDLNAAAPAVQPRHHAMVLYIEDNPVNTLLMTVVFDTAPLAHLRLVIAVNGNMDYWTKPLALHEAVTAPASRFPAALH